MQVSGLLTALNSVSEIVEACTGRLGEMTGEMNREIGSVRQEIGGLNNEIGNSRDDSRKLTQSTAQAAMDEIRHAVEALEEKVTQKMEKNISKLMMEGEQRELSIKLSAEGALEDSRKGLAERESKVDEMLKELQSASQRCPVMIKDLGGRLESEVRELHMRQNGYEGSMESIRAGLEAQIEGLHMQLGNLSNMSRLPQPDHASIALQEAATAARQMQHSFEEKVRLTEQQVHDKMQWNIEQIRRDCQEMIRGIQTNLEDASRRDAERAQREVSSLSERIERGLGEAMHVANQALTHAREAIRTQDQHRGPLAIHPGMSQTMGHGHGTPTMCEIVPDPKQYTPMWEAGLDQTRNDIQHMELRWKGEADRWQMEAQSLRGELQAQRQEFAQMHSVMLKEVEGRNEVRNTET